jgi:anti-sigma factor RsiW
MRVLRCRDVTEQATALLEGGLPWRTRLALRLHLAMCGMCRTYMDQMRKTRAFLARRPLSPLPRAEEDALIARMTGTAGPD